MRVSLVLPTYNEKDTLPELVKKITGMQLGIEMLIVDDNSPDGTGKIAEALAGKYPNIRVYHRMNERGLGSAIKYGFSVAKSDAVGVMDTDLSHDTAALKGIIMELESGADFVIGSRYIEGGGIAEWPRLRRLTSKIATLLVRPLTRVRDPMSGFFFIKKSVITGVEINPESCKICLDLIVRGKHSKLKEVPYIFTNRKKGKTKIFTPREIGKYLKHVAYLYLYKITG